MSIHGKPLLICDLDETLLYTSKDRLGYGSSWVLSNHLHCYLRPGLASFLETCSSHYKLAVWTAAGGLYAKEIVERIFLNIDLEFVWSAGRCTTRYDHDYGIYYPIKNLKKVFKKGYSKERVLMIDDTPRKLERQFGNYIRVKPFEGDRRDDELELLIQYLIRISDCDNFRALEKRNWRSEIKTAE